MKGGFSKIKVIVTDDKKPAGVNPKPFSPAKLYNIYLGVDPGINTGFAVWNAPAQKLLEVKTVNFWGCITHITQYMNLYGASEICLVIEDVIGNRPTFHHNATGAKQREKISQNVGGNKRDCQLIIEYCEMHGIKVVRKVPGRGGSTKLKDEPFKKLTKWEGKTSNHARDAAMLVYGWRIGNK